MEHCALNTLPILRSIRTKTYSGLLPSVSSTAAKNANKSCTYVKRHVPMPPELVGRHWR